VATSDTALQGPELETLRRVHNELRRLSGPKLDGVYLTWSALAATPVGLSVPYCLRDRLDMQAPGSKVPGTSDQDCLESWARQGDADSLQTLVERYLGFVHSSALRRVAAGQRPRPTTVSDGARLCAEHQPQQVEAAKDVTTSAGVSAFGSGCGWSSTQPRSGAVAQSFARSRPQRSRARCSLFWPGARRIFESQRDSVLQPKVATPELPWVHVPPKRPTPTGLWPIRIGSSAHDSGDNPVGVENGFQRLTQGSSFLATAGLMVSSHWDWPLRSRNLAPSC
jgi:hypothetical protein